MPFLSLPHCICGFHLGFTLDAGAGDQAVGLARLRMRAHLLGADEGYVPLRLITRAFRTIPLWYTIRVASPMSLSPPAIA